uniref:DUF4200 domain-containing protein n=1 Tax=Graphocephala atropunctata TaxID=36148 RepID=A0A1B6MNP0_9HEMI
MESMPEERRLLPADYRGLEAELETLPYNTIIKLYHAHQCQRQAQRESIIKNIDEQKEAIYQFMDWSKMCSHKTALRKLFQNSHQAIKEARASLTRFHEKIKESKHQQVALIKEIEDIRRDINTSSATKNKLEQYVNKYSETYTFFLENVTHLDQDFNSVQEVLNRYEALENSRVECSTILRDELDESIELKKEMLKIVEEKSTVLRKLDNSLVMLQIRQKQVKEHMMHWEHNLERIRIRMSATIQESQELTNGCYDLYINMCRRKKMTPTINIDDIENQLKFIQKTILFYKDVIRIATSVRQDQLLILKSKQHKKKISMIKNLLDAPNLKESI